MTFDNNNRPSRNDIVDALAIVLESISIQEQSTDSHDLAKDFDVVVNSEAMGNPDGWAAMTPDQKRQYVADGARPIDDGEFLRAFQAWIALMPEKHTDEVYMSLVATPVVQFAAWEYFRDFWRYDQDLSPTVIYETAGQLEQFLSYSDTGKGPWGTPYIAADKVGWLPYQHVSLFLARVWACLAPLPCLHSEDWEEHLVMLFGALGIYIRLFERQAIPPRFGKWLVEDPRRALSQWEQSYAAPVTSYLSIGMFLGDENEDSSYLVDIEDAEWMKKYRDLLEEGGVSTFPGEMTY